MSKWIGVDLNGTLALYTTGDYRTIGDPIEPMVARVKQWIKDGHEVRIFTARAYPMTCAYPNADLADALRNMNELEDGSFKDGLLNALQAIGAIRIWCERYIGKRLAVTCMKDPDMLELYCDRVVQVEQNTGDVIGYSTRGTSMVATREDHRLDTAGRPFGETGLRVADVNAVLDAAGFGSSRIGGRAEGE